MVQDQVSGLRQAVTGQRRADLDALAHRLRAEGLTYQAIADRLRMDVSMARRRVIRYERTLREQATSAPRARTSSFTSKGLIRVLGEKSAFMGVLSGEFGRDRIGLGRTGVDRG